VTWSRSVPRLAARLWYPGGVPQFTHFPFLPQGAPSQLVDELIAACRAMPADGEPFREFRGRLKSAGLWKAEQADNTLRFLRVPKSKQVKPSPVIEALAAGDDAAARAALTDRLWQVNPLLMKTVVELVSERPHTRDDLTNYINSFAYRGEAVTRVELQSWINLAIGLEILKVVGIALALGGRGDDILTRAKALEVDEFLEEDEPEPDLDGEGEADDDAVADAEPPALAAPAPVEAPKPTVDYESPIGRGRPVAVSRLGGRGVYEDDVLSETRELIDGWWSEQTPSSSLPSAEDFGIDAGVWMEGADEALYRLAVAAALAFRLGRDKGSVVAAFRGLDEAGVLSDLYFGTAPESLPDSVDSQSLMLASLVARRCAESPDLALTMEKQKGAKAAFEELAKALGRGLFTLELFWMMRALGDIGALRLDDLQDVAAIPTRLVRDTLFRLGFLETPYATDSEALIEVAAAAARATSAAAPDQVIEGFALAAGCAYDCDNRRSCNLACRERADLGSGKRS